MLRALVISLEEERLIFELRVSTTYNRQTADNRVQWGHGANVEMSNSFSPGIQLIANVFDATPIVQLPPIELVDALQKIRRLTLQMIVNSWMLFGTSSAYSPDGSHLYQLQRTVTRIALA